MTTPWPSDSANFVGWLRDTIDETVQNTPEVRVEDLGKAEISADLDGTDLKILTLDATGLRVRFVPAPVPDATVAVAPPVPLDRRAGTLRLLRATASPLRIDHTDVKVDVQAFDVPIQWLTFSEPVKAAAPSSIRTLAVDETLSGARVTFDVSVRADDFSALITAVLQPALREGGVHLTRLRVEVSDDGLDGIRITAFAGLRWRALRASAHADAGVQIGADGVITVRTLKIASRNPLVKCALLFARKPLRDAIGKTVDLNEQLRESGIRLHLQELCVRTGERVGIFARLA